MSGYLQRLTRSVMQPSQRVHPMVGSIFAPASSEPGDEVGETLETSETVVAKQPESQRRDLRDHAPLPTSMESRNAHEQPSIQERKFEPLMPESIHVNAPGVLDTEDTTSITPRETKREPAADVALAPLMPLRERRVTPLGQPAATMRRPETKTETERTTQREPDEIQIHIGRVEVLAVPQTQARVIPKATRKAPSLDEYLRRRDGRSL